MRSTTFLFLILTFVSCGGSGGGGGNEATSEQAANQTSADTGTELALDEISESEVVPSAALNFEVNLKLDNFNSQQEDKVLEASDLIKKVVTSNAFKNAILNHKVNGKKTFVDNKGLSNSQIYKKIIEASENLNPGKDNTMDLELEVYKESSSTIGYTYPNVNRVWMNAKFLNSFRSYEVTTNMTHEWLHKLGFTHNKKPTPSRKYSVPYAIGYLMSRLAKNYT